MKTETLTSLKCIISTSIGEINQVTMFHIIYQLKFVSILTIIYISLFGYNFVFLDAAILQKYFKGDNHCPVSHYH